jgi:hypothetical protein
MSEIDPVEPAKRAYQAYGDKAEWKNFRGDPMPTWDALGERIQGCWIVAAAALAVRDLSEWTDGTTEQMRQETGHDCITCPSNVRNLTATAHNALSQWDANQRDLPDRGRMHRKMEDLRGALVLLQPVVDDHFEALNSWRRP